MFAAAWRARPPLQLGRRAISTSMAVMDRRHHPQDPMRGPNAKVEHDKDTSSPAPTETPQSDASPAPSSSSGLAQPPPSQPPSSSSSSAPSTGPHSSPPPQQPTPPSEVEAVAATSDDIPPIPPHPIDTHAFTTRLEAASLPSAKALVGSIKSLISTRTTQARRNMLSQSERDNDAYHFKAALSTLRAEQSSRARKDSATMRAATATIRREVDLLTQRMREDIASMRHDVDMEMDSRKSDTRAELKRYEIAVQEINNKFTISLSDLRTEIESAKWDATRRAIAIIAVLVVSGVILSTVNVMPAAAAVPTYVDVGVGPGPGPGAGGTTEDEGGHDTDALDEIIQRLREEKRV